MFSVLNKVMLEMLQEQRKELRMLRSILLKIKKNPKLLERYVK